MQLMHTSRSPQLQSSAHMQSRPLAALTKHLLVAGGGGENLVLSPCGGAAAAAAGRVAAEAAPGAYLCDTHLTLPLFALRQHQRQLSPLLQFPCCMRGLEQHLFSGGGGFSAREHPMVPSGSLVVDVMIAGEGPLRCPL